jgi:hypothetical protein
MQLRPLDAEKLRQRYKPYHKKETKMQAEILKRTAVVSNRTAMPSRKTFQQIFQATTLPFFIKKARKIA